jgi:ABC-type phosphate transport system substrate-binding protein
MLDRLRSLRRLFAAAGVLSLLAALVLALPAHAAGPAVTIDPSTRLSDNQFVTVSWSGFKPNGEVWIRECASGAATLDACSDVNTTLLVTGRDGTGVTVYQVHTGQMGTATCDYQHACQLGVFPKVDSITGAVFADIAFAFPPDACPSPTGTTAGGSGDDTANLSMFQWSADVCQAPQSLSIHYIGSNSYDGLSNFGDGSSDFAASTVPLAAADQRAAKSLHRKWTYAPINESGLVLAYNIVDQRNGQRITNLKLTPDLIAKIFTKSELGIWNVAEVLQINPGHTFPPLVGAVGRADHTPSTLLLTRYMKATAPDIYTCKPTNNYSTSPCDLGITLKTTPEDAAAAVWQHTDADLSQTGYIGWMDSSTAAFYGLPAAQIQTQADPPVYQTTTQASIDKAISDATVNKDGVTITPQFTADPDAYPLPELTVAVLPTSCITSDLQQVLTSYTTWAVADGQSEDSLPLGYFKLSDDQVTKANAAVSKLSSATDCPSPPPPPPPPPPGGNGGGGLPPPPPTTPPPSPTSSSFSPSPTPTIQYTAAGARLSTPLSSSLIPILIAIGVIGVLLGPAIEVLSRPRWRRRKTP